MTHPLVEALRSSDPARRHEACLAAPDDPSAVLLADALGEALGDPVREVSKAAAEALVRIGLRQRGVEDALRRALRCEDPRRRYHAAAAFARLAPPSPSLVPALVAALGHPEGDVRWGAARLLVDTGRLHGEVLGILLGLLGGAERPRVRRMAAFALRELAPDHPACARALVVASEDDDPDVKRAALSAMASLLVPGPEVERRLLRALDEDPDPASRRIAAVALGALGESHPGWLSATTEARLRALAEGAADTDLRRGAARALARLAAARSEVSPR